MTTGRRLAIGAFAVLIIIAYMAYLGALSSWQYYLSVDECVAHGRSLIDHRIRVSGTIAPNTLDIQGGDAATFQLEGIDGGLLVKCSGRLPDDLAEGRQVVVEGRLQDVGVLSGDKLLTRCASKYTSQQVRGTPEECSTRRSR
jgi:cytochrome c-type biogenesis protein CcmE